MNNSTHSPGNKNRPPETTDELYRKVGQFLLNNPDTWYTYERLSEEVGEKLSRSYIV